MQYENVFMQLEDFGLFDVLLPFLLIFSFSFIIAQQLPKIERKQAGILALVISFLSVATHVIEIEGVNFDVVDFINGIIPGITGLVIAIIGFFFILALIAPKFVEELGGDNPNYPILMIAIPLIIVVYIVVTQAGLVGENSSISLGVMGSWLENPENAALATMIIVIIVTIWFVAKEGKSKYTLKNFFEDLFIGRKNK